MKSPKILHIMGLTQQLRELEEKQFKLSNFNEVGSLLPSEDNVIAINNFNLESIFWHTMCNNENVRNVPFICYMIWN